MTEIITHPIAMLFYGLAAHFLKDMARLAKEGQRMGLADYWLAFPYQSGISMIGAVAGFAALQEAGHLSGITAFGVGYMANSVADVIGKRAGERL